MINKSPLNKITITEIQKNAAQVKHRPPKKAQKRVKSLSKEVVHAECDIKSAERDLLDKNDPDKSEQIATLVSLLRKSKAV